MDHSEYYYNIPLYAQDLYLPDNSAASSSAQPVLDQPLDQLYSSHYRYQRPLQMHTQQHQQQQQQQQQQHPHQQLQRPHSHPQHTQQSYPYHGMHHDQLRHAHSHPALSRVSSSYSHRSSPPHTARSSPSATSAYSDPLSALRDDLQVHAAAAALAQASGPTSITGGELYVGSGVPRLPPILQVEKQQVTTTATQAASAIRRRNEASFRCPVPGCGSTFTRRFNLKGHLRSHTSERPYACEWPGCDKAFARQHDCKRHYQLHSAKAGSHMCPGCGKSFSRTDALNRHLRSEGGVDCRAQAQASGSSSSRDLHPVSPRGDDSGSPSDTTDGTYSGTSRSRPPSV